jgi:hypothetical protein
MKIRATLLSFAKVAALTTAVGACAAPQNKVMADTPVLPYEAPTSDDIAEITGIEEPDEDVSEDEPDAAPAPEEKAPAPAPAPAAAPTKTPAAPTKAPAKAPAKAAAPAKAPAPAPEKK